MSPSVGSDCAAVTRCQCHAAVDTIRSERARRETRPSVIPNFVTLTIAARLCIQRRVGLSESFGVCVACGCSPVNRHLGESHDTALFQQFRVVGTGQLARTEPLLAASRSLSSLTPSTSSTSRTGPHSRRSQQPVAHDQRPDRQDSDSRESLRSFPSDRNTEGAAAESPI